MTGTVDFLYSSLADDLESQISAGVYRTGERLPSIRNLRRERGVSISTVSQALLELERRGLVEARPRSGYFVTPPTLAMKTPSLKRHRVRPRRVPVPHLADDFVSASADGSLVPLGGAVLSPDLLPLKQLSRVARSVVSGSARAFARYGPPAGAPELRRTIAKRMLGLGLPVGLDEVVISAGCMDSIRLALLATTKPGDLIALESPTFFGFLQAVRDLGLYALEIPTHPDRGIDVDALDRAAKRHAVRAAVITPIFQNPTGACMPQQDKERIAKLAKRRGFTIIEDDVYGDLVFAAPRPAPIAALGIGDVIYCTSLSKTLAPGLRLGWLLPGEHLDRVRRLKLSGTITSPALNQLVAAEVLDGGSYERHLRRLRVALKTQVATMRRALAMHLPAGTEVTQPEGGFLLWVRLPKGVDAHRVYQRAAQSGVSILPGTLCAVDDKYRRYIRINAGYPWSPLIESAVKTLGELVARDSEQRQSVG